MTTQPTDPRIEEIRKRHDEAAWAGSIADAFDALANLAASLASELSAIVESGNRSLQADTPIAEPLALVQAMGRSVVLNRGLVDTYKTDIDRMAAELHDERVLCDAHQAETRRVEKELSSERTRREGLERDMMTIGKALPTDRAWSPAEASLFQLCARIGANALSSVGALVEQLPISAPTPPPSTAAVVASSATGEGAKCPECGGVAGHFVSAERPSGWVCPGAGKKPPEPAEKWRPKPGELVNGLGAGDLKGEGVRYSGYFIRMQSEREAVVRPCDHPYEQEWFLRADSLKPGAADGDGESRLGTDKRLPEPAEEPSSYVSLIDSFVLRWPESPVSLYTATTYLERVFNAGREFERKGRR